MNARRAGRLALVLVLMGTSGCSMFRAQFGGGIGAGIDLKLPGLAHTGLSAGQYMNVGIRYDDPELSQDVNVTLLAWHAEGRQNQRRETGKRVSIFDHGCWGGLPPVTTWRDDDALAIWDLEIGLNLLVIDLRLGFNPLRLDRGGERKKPPQEPRLPYPTRPAPRLAPYERDPLMPGAVDPPTDAGD